MAAPNAAHLVRAGDCEAWVLRDGIWRRVFPRQVLREPYLTRWRLWEGNHGETGTLERSAAEDEILPVPDAWRTCAVGRSPTVLLEQRVVRDCESLVLSSDGARLTSAALADLPAWLANLRTWEATHAQVAVTARGGVKVHDDVTVIRISAIEHQV